VVYVVKDAESKNNDLVETLYSTGQSFSSKISRGINFYFMWLDASKETKFANMFGFSQEELPKLVILNPGKRKRYLVHDKEINDKDIS
jgi:hypothetical protein